MNNLSRRSSSGVLLSPDVEFTSGIIKPLDASESDPFIVKKNSQRRITLLDVLAHDEDKICDIWLDKIESNHDVDVMLTRVNIQLTICPILFTFILLIHRLSWLIASCNLIYLQEHLGIMNRALREYISDQKRETLESVMSLLKMKMNFDATAIDHLHLALLSFKVCKLLTITLITMIILQKQRSSNQITVIYSKLKRLCT